MGELFKPKTNISSIYRVENKSQCVIQSKAFVGRSNTSKFMSHETSWHVRYIIKRVVVQSNLDKWIFDKLITLLK